MFWSAIFLIVTAETASLSEAEISGPEPRFWCKKGDPEQKLAVFPQIFYFLNLGTMDIA